jgi:hypothetical protein
MCSQSLKDRLLIEVGALCGFALGSLSKLQYNMVRANLFMVLEDVST